MNDYNDHDDQEMMDGQYVSEFKAAYGILYFLAVLNPVLGLIVVFAGVEFLQEVGIGWYDIALGVALGALGAAAHMTKSIIPVVLGIVLFGGEFLLGAAFMLSEGETPPIGGVIFRGFLVYTMAKPVISKIRGA